MDRLAMRVIDHALERRRHRAKSYYICGCCSNQFLYNRPKDRICPICFSKQLTFMQTVDEFTEDMINAYSEGTVLNGDDKEFIQNCRRCSDWLLKNASKEYTQKMAACIVNNINLRKESY